MTKMEPLELEDGIYVNKLIVKNYRNRHYRIGLCTGWDEVENYKDMDVDVIGTLYTANGAKIMLRNIFANPSIRAIIILDTNYLGQNSVGNKGLKMIHDIFFEQYGCPNELCQYDLQMLRKCLNVYYITNNTVSSLISEKISTCSRSNISICETIRDIIKREHTHGYVPILRQRIKYACEITNTPDFVPNEYIGKSIRGTSLFDAWFDALSHVYKFGKLTKDEIKEYHSIHWSFPVCDMENTIAQYRKIITQPEMQQLFGLDIDILNDYAKTITSNIVVPNSAYTYGNRLDIFKDRILSSLRENIGSRHAFGTTIKYDTVDRQAPCLIYIQLLYNCVDDEMNMYVVFRSHDMFKAALLNAYALGKLLQEYCSAIGKCVGRIEVTSISAHIYKSDLNNVSQLLNCLEHHVSQVIHYDPCGNCIVQKIDVDVYQCDIVNPKTGILMKSIKGTPIEIFYKILSDKLITDTEHLKYIFEMLNDIKK